MALVAQRVTVSVKTRHCWFKAEILLPPCGPRARLLGRDPLSAVVLVEEAELKRIKLYTGSSLKVPAVLAVLYFSSSGYLCHGEHPGLALGTVT